MGKIADENPDLPLDFIKGVLEGKLEMEQGEVSAFSFRAAPKIGVSSLKSVTVSHGHTIKSNRK
jgi:hypothetical protein